VYDNKCEISESRYMDTNIHLSTPAHVPKCIAVEPLYETFGQAFVAELLIANYMSRSKALKLFALQLSCNFVRMALFPGFSGPWFKKGIEFATYFQGKFLSTQSYWF
jgi:hypothetical protein